MKHLKAFSILIVLVILIGGLSRVHAIVTTFPPANPPASNTWFPINVGATDQSKQGGLSVIAFNALQSAEFEKDLYLQGQVFGPGPLNVPSTVAIGGSGPQVDTMVSGSLAAENSILSGKLINGTNSMVCADAAGRIVLCANGIPQVILTPNPASVYSGDPSDLTVYVSNFDTITSCTIDNGVGVVTMNNTAPAQFQGHKTKTNITTATLFHVTCLGTTGGSPQSAIASALVAIKPTSPTGYYAHCFVADTQVTMADGSKKYIQDVKLGDVLKGDKTNNTVVGFHQPQLGTDKLYGFNGGTAFVTAEHPFMTTAGWKSINPDKTKKENIGITVTPLHIGDTLVTDKGLVKVNAINSTSAPANTQLYNFILTGDHTYFANGYLVHNKTLCGSSYGACPSGTTCIDETGQPTAGGGSCTVSCIPGQPVTTGYCNNGGALACSADGQKICI